MSPSEVLMLVAVVLGGVGAVVAALPRQEPLRARVRRDQ